MADLIKPEDVEVREAPTGTWTAYRVRPATSTHPWLLIRDRDSAPSGFYPEFEVADWTVIEAPHSYRRAMLDFAARFPERSP